MKKALLMAMSGVLIALISSSALAAKKASKPKHYTPDAKLAAVVGNDEHRTKFQMTRDVWVYIKANKLQDPKNRRNINLDDNLKAMYGGKSQITMFEIPGAIKRHTTLTTDNETHD